MRVTRRDEAGRPLEVEAVAHDDTTSVYRISGVTLQRSFKVDHRPWYDVPTSDWQRFTPDQLRAVACLLDGAEMIVVPYHPKVAREQQEYRPTVPTRRPDANPECPNPGCDGCCKACPI